MQSEASVLAMMEAPSVWPFKPSVKTTHHIHKFFGLPLHFDSVWGYSQAMLWVWEHNAHCQTHRTAGTSRPTPPMCGAWFIHKNHPAGLTLEEEHSTSQVLPMNQCVASKGTAPKSARSEGCQGATQAFRQTQTLQLSQAECLWWRFCAKNVTVFVCIKWICCGWKVATCYSLGRKLCIYLLFCTIVHQKEN